MRKRKINGYPPAYWQGLRRGIARFLSFFFAVGGVFLWLAFNVVYSNAPIAVASWVGGFFFYLLLVLCISIVSKPKLALYFEVKVPGDWVWSAPLARNCAGLDVLCEQLAIEKFSSFGFTDEQSGKAMVWHAPEAGLEITLALIHHLRANLTAIEETSAVLEDLQKMRNRLREAETKRVRFCFILHEGSINAMEIEQRRGSF